jgi:hypothetical protein
LCLVFLPLCLVLLLAPLHRVGIDNDFHPHKTRAIPACAGSQGGWPEETICFRPPLIDAPQPMESIAYRAPSKRLTVRTQPRTLGSAAAGACTAERRAAELSRPDVLLWLPWSVYSTRCVRPKYSRGILGAHLGL